MRKLLVCVYVYMSVCVWQDIVDEGREGGWFEWAVGGGWPADNLCP